MSRKGLCSRLNEKSRLSVVNADEYKPMKLAPDTLVPSEKNFYELSDIEELADNMRLVGHLDPVVIGKVNGEYKIISGHRRTKAAVLNKERGYKDFNEINCLVKEMSENMFMLTLLSANAFNRKLSDWEQVEQARQMKIYMTKAKEDGLEIPGKMRDYIASQLGISSGKMAQIEKINNNLCDEGKKALQKGDINFTKAYEAAGLPEEKQKQVIKDKSLLASDVKKIAKSGKVSESDTGKLAITNGDRIRLMTNEQLVAFLSRTVDIQRLMCTECSDNCYYSCKNNQFCENGNSKKEILENWLKSDQGIL